MSKAVQQAKSIIALSKGLRAFRIGDANIAMYFSATNMAGRAGLLASAIRSHEALDIRRFSVMAANEGFSQIELRTTIYPWLEEQLLCTIQRVDGEIFSVRSLILTYDQLLKAVSKLWESLSPHLVERACIEAYTQCNTLPIGRAELMQKLTTQFDENTAAITLDLINGYRLLAKVERGLIEPLYYSSSVWKGAMIERSAKSLSVLNVTEKEILLAMIEQVKQHQGLPEDILVEFARGNNSLHLLNLAKRTGILDSTKIKTAAMVERSFLISPHFYADVTEEHGEDFCDRVKIFLDSIRNGQHFGQPGTGKITDPARLLEVLLNRGWVGPATAIGSGYVLPEKAGIIRVDRDTSSTWKFKLHLVQSDTVAVVKQLITSGSPEPGLAEMRAANLQPEVGFSAVETIRASTIGDVPTLVAEAEAELLRTLRESRCRT